ncbi:MAG: DUF6036 family nucleotidyltransferase [Nanoarchaeota archaeon]
MSKQSSREGLLEREEEIFRILNMLIQHKMNFIVVGGYAVSTYKKRFSVDLDVIIKEKDTREFETLLEKEGYVFHYEKNISLVYGENFKRYLRSMKNLPVYIDFLINGLVSRTTNAVWSFEHVKENSVTRTLNGLQFLTPKRELLIAMKLHSGRLSDVRDIVALMPCDIKELKKHLIQGDISRLMISIKKQATFLGKLQFDDSFKGIFGIQAYKEEEVEQARVMMEELMNQKK